MRALIVDDQSEFCDSVRPTLKKSGFNTEYACDLSSALAILSQREFDLILTDLQMPPGNWGGLDVIKAVREIDGVVPLFVVSGKGSLAECIQALRLGATDYIQKEVFASDFVQRVQPCFARPYAVEHFPSLIAYLFRSFEEEQVEFTKARRLIDVFENTMRLLSLIIIAEQSRRSGETLSRLLETSNMQRPSLGSYVAFVFERLTSDWNGKVLAALRASDLARSRGDCDRLTECRNQDFGHSTVISTHRSVEIVEMFSATLTRFLNSLSCIRRFRLFVATTLRFDGVTFLAEGRLLSGYNLHHPGAKISLSMPIPTGHVILMAGMEVVADLAPLVEIIPSEKGEWSAYRIYSKVGRSEIEYESIPK